MAQQATHNVVSHFESTSGRPLVDVAANQSTTESAISGDLHSTTSFKTSTHHIESAARHEKFAGEGPYHGHSATPNGHAEIHLGPSTADPSAGDVVQGSGQASASSFSRGPTDSASGEGINGVHDESSHDDGPADDRSTADISIDVSDTDTSKADASEKRDGKPLFRNNSTKKSTVFSKVSITKSFLAKAATAAPVVTKPGDKLTTAAAITTPIAKPRLVAKTGTALQSQKSRPGSETSGTPDPSKVWNKNQPVALPPPKQFTDEELKQQYGIHMATRLQSDEGGKESKWADIDDDEEDWAPDTIAWMDGTKSTVTAQDAATPAKDEAPVNPQPVKPAETAKPTLISMKRPDQSMKILKPGVAIIQAKQSGSTASTPGTEKQSLLKTKSPAPAPTKSPWAAIPKVESISPINPPVQQSQVPAPAPTLAPQDARAYDSTIPPVPTATLIPAREIAADTFDRSWKEGEGGSRELFNSTNGRYEPAPEPRRNSVKPDAALRKPAVLRRPSQSLVAPPDMSLPPNRNASLVDSAFKKRRESSVSQGSVPPTRQPQRSLDSDAVEKQQGSNTGRLQQPDQALPDGSSVSTQTAVEQPATHIPAAEPEIPATPAEDPVKMQERVMREKREMAIKRRKEEAEREEIAKQERLKAKLAALAGAGKSKKEREAEAAATKLVSTTPAEPIVLPAAKTEAETTVPKDKSPVQPKATYVPPTMKAPVLPDTTPKPPQETKVVPPVSDVKPTQPASESKLPLPPPQPEKQQPSQPQPLLADRPVPSEHVPKTAPVRSHLSPATGSRVPFQQPASNAYKGSVSSLPSPRDRKLQPYLGRSPNMGGDTFTPWPTSVPNGNVWGSSGIGNGVFENTSSFAPVPMSQQSSSLPPPPGMGRPGASNRISTSGHPQESRSPNLQTQAVEELRPFASSGLDTRGDPFGGQPRLSGAPSAAAGLTRQAHPPGPIGPPSRTQPPQQPVSRADPVSAWNNAAQRLSSHQLPPDADAPLPRHHESTIQPNHTPEMVYKETFRKTASEQGKLGDARRFEKKEYSVNMDAPAGKSVPAMAGGPQSSHFPPSPAPKAFMTSPAPHDPWRRVSDSVRMPDNPPMPIHVTVATPVQPPIRPPSVQLPPLATHQVKYSPLLPTMQSTVDVQSPPPPESESHPVNAGTDSYPHVRLPPPQVKVKLPPTSPSASSVHSTVHVAPVLMPQRQSVHHGVHVTAPPKPIIMNGEWQARFNGLFNRTPIQTETPPSPPKTPPKMQGVALAVASSSRVNMDDAAYALANNATVSLPHSRRVTSKEGFTIDTSADVISKPSIDHMFNEELSFGSMPVVRVPRNTRYNTLPYSGFVLASLRMSPSSPACQSYTEYFSWHKSPLGYFVKIPGTKLNNKLIKHDSKAGMDGRRGMSSNNTYHDRRTNSRINKSRPGKPDSQSPSANDARRDISGKSAAAPMTGTTNSADDGAMTNGTNEMSKSADRTRSSWHKPRFPRHSQAASIKSN